jgi:hypothetical protein
MYDFIGDIHGHADHLEQLLSKLGYTNSAGTYTHKTRKAFFVGDYIDRGPKIRKTLEIVRSMVDNGNAIALLGNHEYNALCFHAKRPEGGHLRKHSIKNIIQHFKTLEQFQNQQNEYEDYLDWFKTLPVFYEEENFRAVHAAWDKSSISYLKQHLNNNCLTDDLIAESCRKGSPLKNSIEITIKGKEIKMPDPLFFIDKDGTHRQEIRIKWWNDPVGTTYKEISIEPIDNLPHTVIEPSAFTNLDYYQEEDKPIFFGHYWLKGNPFLYRNNICCLDYSVAKHGHLAAYRFDGEKDLEVAKLFYV